MMTYTKEVYKHMLLNELSEQAVDNIFIWLSEHATFVSWEPVYVPYQYDILNNEYSQDDQSNESIDQPCEWRVDYKGLVTYDGEINCSPNEAVESIEAKRNFLVSFFEEVDDLQKLKDLIDKRILKHN